MGTDVMLQSWHYFQGFALPPFDMIRQVLNRRRQYQDAKVRLIVPLWRKRLVPGPIRTTGGASSSSFIRRDLLKQPHYHRYRLNLAMLALHVWRLCSDLPEQRDSPPEWLRSWLGQDINPQ